MTIYEFWLILNDFWEKCGVTRLDNKYGLWKQK